MQVTVTPLLVTIERLKPGSAPPVKLASIAASPRVKGSLLRVAWDDPDNPFLARRRPAATLSPRAVADNPDKEVSEYRIDSGPWKAMTRDRRDIWTDSFMTSPLSIGIHTTDVRLTTSAGVANQEELIFEVERDTNEETRRWAIDLPDAITSSPVRDPEALYVTCTDGKVYSISVATGKKRWTFPAKAPFYASPLLAEGVLYAASVDGTLYALETATGHMKWKYEAGPGCYAAPTLEKNTLVYAAGEQLLGIDIETGLRHWATPLNAPATADLTHDNGQVFANTADGILIAADAATGTVRWRYPAVGEERLSPRSSAAVSAGLLFAAGADGSLHALFSQDGRRSYLRACPDPTDPALETPAIGTGMVFTGGRRTGSIYAFDIPTGTPHWHTSIGQPIASKIAVHENGRTAAVLGLRGHCIVFGTAKGERLWGYELGPGNIYSTPLYDGNILYTATIAGDVQAINGPGVTGGPQRSR